MMSMMVRAMTMTMTTTIMMAMMTTMTTMMVTMVMIRGNEWVTMAACGLIMGGSALAYTVATLIR